MYNIAVDELNFGEGWRPPEGSPTSERVSSRRSSCRPPSRFSVSSRYSVSDTTPIGSTAPLGPGQSDHWLSLKASLCVGHFCTYTRIYIFIYYLFVYIHSPKKMAWTFLQIITLILIKELELKILLLLLKN